MRLDTAGLHKLLEAEFSKYLDGLSGEALYEPIQYALSGNGKRIRPLLVLMGCNVFTDELEAALPAALAVEIFHNFTLVHDDIMDEAPLRRGRATVHKRWSINGAILSGDAMLIEAYTLLNRMEIPEKTTVISAFNETALDVCRGQQFDMDFEKRKDVSVAEYLEMIGLKTAVLLGCSLKIGALIGGADPKEAQEMYAFGKSAGMAFQLQDDYLDAFGDPETFGKQPGGDILSNKKTYLIIRALEKAKSKQKRELEELYYLPTNKGDGAEKVAKVISIFRDLGIDKETRKLSDRHFAEAVGHLNRISAGPFAKKPLRDFVDGLKNRRK